MYVCGPTVYKPSHIGHMVGPVIFDTVKRYLKYVGYEVTWVVNITDVDDKLIDRGHELGVADQFGVVAQRRELDAQALARRAVGGGWLRYTSPLRDCVAQSVEQRPFKP